MSAYELTIGGVPVPIVRVDLSAGVITGRTTQSVSGAVEVRRSGVGLIHAGKAVSAGFAEDVTVRLHAQRASAAVEAVKGEARFRIKSVRQFTGSIDDETARVIIARAAQSVRRNPEAFWLSKWPLEVSWQEVSREVADEWIGRREA